MPSGFARSNQFNPWTATANNISQTLLDMPAARQKGYERGQRAGLMQLQGETEQAQADNYRASAGLTNTKNQREQFQLQELMKAVASLQEKGLIRTNDAGDMVVDAEVGNELVAASVAQSQSAGDMGLGAQRLSQTFLAAQEARKNREAAASRAKYSADVSAETQRSRPVVANGALFDQEGNLLNPGVQRVSQGGSLFLPDETSVGWKAGPSVPGRETTPRSQAIRDQLKAQLIKDGLTGTNLSAALNEFDQGGQSPEQMPQRPTQNGYVVGQRYKGGLIYMGGNPNDPQSWQRAQ